MKTELERYKGALEYTIGELMRMHAISGERVRDDVGKILNPPALPPEMETVEVKRSMCGNCEKVWKNDQTAVNCCEETATCDTPIIHLTGTYQRPKPQMVEKSMSGKVRWERDALVKDFVIPFATDSGSFNFFDVEGKTGTLTFTWTEAPK